MTKILGNRPCAQGDILLVPVDCLPENVRKAEAKDGVYVVAHSETGHNHVIEATRGELYEAADDEFVAYIRSLGDGVDLTHKREFHTHEAYHIPPNKVVKVYRQREHTPEGFRRAQD